MSDYTNLATKGDFVETGINIFESEDVTESLLRIYLSLCVDGWRGVDEFAPCSIDFLGNFYLQGMWLPCVPRVAIAGALDCKNDGLPQWSSIPLRHQTGTYSFVAAQRIADVKKLGFCPIPGAQTSYLIAEFIEAAQTREFTRAAGRGETRGIDSWIYSAMGDRLIPAKNLKGASFSPSAAAALAVVGAAAIQMPSDFKNLWIVRTEERLVGKTMQTPIRLGVDSEIIKSLFYARQKPLTDTGRRRPILHWVRSHLRRIQTGIDVDIRQHLRGITEFEMDGFPFQITQPFKDMSPKTARAA